MSIAAWIPAAIAAVSALSQKQQPPPPLKSRNAGVVKPPQQSDMPLLGAATQIGATIAGGKEGSGAASAITPAVGAAGSTPSPGMVSGSGARMGAIDNRLNAGQNDQALSTALMALQNQPEDVQKSLRPGLEQALKQQRRGF